MRAYLCILFGPVLTVEFGYDLPYHMCPLESTFRLKGTVPLVGDGLDQTLIPSPVLCSRFKTMGLLPLDRCESFFDTEHLFHLDDIRQ